jgi:hypothetical protein
MDVFTKAADASENEEVELKPQIEITLDDNETKDNYLLIITKILACVRFQVYQYVKTKRLHNNFGRKYSGNEPSIIYEEDIEQALACIDIK